MTKLLKVNFSMRTYLSILIAHKLKIEAVQSNTSNDIQISHSTHPKCHEPANKRKDTNFHFLVTFGSVILFLPIRK